jgi:hypothetical protein
MKKIFLSLILASALLVSCGEKKEEATEKTIEAGYSIKENSIILKWIAYKTTEKIPVGGEFTKVNVTDLPVATSPEKSIEGLNFSIPVSSLFTNNESRDYKLKNLFFGVMDNTELISGSFTTIEGNDKEGHGVINLKMNNIPCDLPFDYTIEGNVINIESELNVKSWKAENALDSLNKACYDLHKGADGVSKTWEDVSITASVEFEKN